MATLSARFVKAARKRYWCACGRAIDPGKAYLRLYGMADIEKPWTLRYCLSCTVAEVAPQERHAKRQDAKILVAIETAEAYHKATVKR